WSALVVVVLVAIASSFRARGEWIAAGLFIVAMVISWGVFLAALFTWWGFLASPYTPFDGWHFSILLLVSLIISAARGALKLYRFPLLVAIMAATIWYLVVGCVRG